MQVSPQRSFFNNSYIICIENDNIFRHLHCVQSRDRTSSLLWDLAGFKRLTSLRIDWLSTGKVSLPFLNVESKIKELDIRGLRDPSPILINILTFPFIDLVTLRLDCMKIWCSLCNTSNLVRFPSPNPEGSPTKFVYEDGLGLPVSRSSFLCRGHCSKNQQYIYARFFLHLQNLEEVFIRLPDVGPRYFTPGLSAKANDNLWTGECDQCMDWLYPDEEFRRKWVNKKKGILPSSDSKKEEHLLYQRPPRLRKVHWSFWKLYPFTNDGPFTQDDIDSDEETPWSDDD